ncbi:MAG: lysophospholipase [Enterovirga sp.]|nr:lysophospholipase [Enterovirga sp.]
MALHLIKLCVGCDTIEDLEAWIVERRRLAGATTAYEHIHTTRMVPKRHEALVDGGSLFWVIKGQLACRQRLLAVRPFTDGEGVGRCRLALEPVVVPVRPRPYRPFQGWRYLEPDDAPPDLAGGDAGLAVLPEPMRRELAELGLL